VLGEGFGFRVWFELTTINPTVMRGVQHLQHRCTIPTLMLIHDLAQVADLIILPERFQGLFSRFGLRVCFQGLGFSRFGLS